MHYDTRYCTDSFRSSGHLAFLRCPTRRRIRVNRAGAVLKIALTTAALTLAFVAFLSRAEALPRGPQDANGNNVPTQVIGGRPAGCPRAYCGCGLRKFLGIDDVRLNLAANWAKLFPHTHAQSGVAAARSHHVMWLIAHVQGSQWLVRDYNSGGGLSRIHVRDVRGFQFVSVTGVPNGTTDLAAKSRDNFSLADAGGKTTRGSKSARRWRTTRQMGQITNFGTTFGAIQ